MLGPHRWTLSGQTGVPERLGLLASQALTRRAVLKRAVNRLRDLNQSPRVAWMEVRSRAHPNLVFAASPRDDAMLERLAGHRGEVGRVR
jgi:hypothetical protein